MTGYPTSIICSIPMEGRSGRWAEGECPAKESDPYGVPQNNDDSRSLVQTNAPIDAKRVPS
ncbi:hypothetical protein CULT_1600006 [[Clostridium] ultunense Esp]|nr:hypothetical protein CULT_1600006 [[Clostridium] ultunense Esp]